MTLVQSYVFSTSTLIRGRLLRVELKVQKSIDAPRNLLSQQVLFRFLPTSI
jgi:hypothetical protein